ncbi:MAG: hypothetical protein ACJ8GN_20220 [Longimicrobiaceae bacterium]
MVRMIARNALPSGAREVREGGLREFVAAAPRLQPHIPTTITPTNHHQPLTIITHHDHHDHHDHHHHHHNQYHHPRPAPGHPAPQSIPTACRIPFVIACFDL